MTHWRNATANSRHWRKNSTWNRRFVPPAKIWRFSSLPTIPWINWPPIIKMTRTGWKKFFWTTWWKEWWRFLEILLKLLWKLWPAKSCRLRFDRRSDFRCAASIWRKWKFNARPFADWMWKLAMAFCNSSPVRWWFRKRMCWKFCEVDQNCRNLCWCWRRRNSNRRWLREVRKFIKAIYWETLLVNFIEECFLFLRKKFIRYFVRNLRLGIKSWK